MRLTAAQISPGSGEKGSFRRGESDRKNMEMLHCEFEHDRGVLTARLTGAVDHHSVRTVRDEIDLQIARCRPARLILNTEGVTFMDSSGLGLILGRYAKISDRGGKMTVCGVSDEILRILTLAGVEKFIEIQRKERIG